MKTVICSVNSKYIHSSLAPWCLLAGVRAFSKTSQEVKVTEGTINESIDNIFERIIAEKPDVAAFSTYIWNVNTVKQIIIKLKAFNPNLIIILGGPEVSYNADKILSENTNVDYIISGEGEKPFSELLDALINQSELNDISGLCYRNNGKIIVSEPCILKDEPPSPYTEEYFDSLKGRIAYLETSRGCPYSCAFCLSGRCGTVRFFDIERAKREILLLANSGTKTVKLVDRTFNANKKRAKEIFSFVIENYGDKIPEGVCIHFEIAGDILDSETIKMLNSAPTGSIQLEIGLQSFNSRTLEYINRKTDTEKLKANILKLTDKNNIHIHIDLIAGLPYEDKNSFIDSFNTAFYLNPNMLQLGFLKLLYGAPMREESEKFPCEFSESPPYEITSTPWLGENDVKELKAVEDALERVNNSARFRRTLRFVFESTQITPYEFYKQFSQYLEGKELKNIHIDLYSEYLFEFICNCFKISRSVLRDKMVCDRLAVNFSGTLPTFLRIDDKYYKKYRNALNSAVPVKNGNSHKRGFAILYSKNQVVYSDYLSFNPVIKEYDLNFIEFEKIF